MAQSFLRTVVFLLLGVVFSLMACSNAQLSADTPAKGGVPGPVAAGWSRHSDPTGFSVDTPSGWTVTTDRQFGRITIAGRQGEQLTIWPMFVRDRQLDRNGAGAVLQQLARKINASLPWGKPEISANMARVIARNAQRNGVTLLSWRISPSGTAIYVYGIEAAPNVYRASVDTFTGILGSFRIQGVATDVGSTAKSASPQTYSFVRWTDPRENAFSINVPQGWNTVGGLYRLSATDVRPSLQLLSPDHQIWVFVNDASIGIFMQPSQMLMRSGFREGSMYPLPDGSKIAVRRYLPGQQFAQEYVESVMRRRCGDLRVLSSSSRPDLVSAYRAELISEGVPGGNPQVTAGDVSFTCSVRDKSSTPATPMRGYVAAGTVSLSVGQSPLWFAQRIYGYFAPAERQAEADAVCQQAAKSFQLNPQWRMKQREISAATVQQDNQRSQQIRSRAMAAIAQDQRQTSEMISSSYAYRQKTLNETSRREENVILGTVEVVDPNSGKQYKIAYNSDYHWMSDRGYIAGTQTATSPGEGWHQMIDLP